MGTRRALVDVDPGDERALDVTDCEQRLLVVRRRFEDDLRARFRDEADRRRAFEDDRRVNLVGTRIECNDRAFSAVKAVLDRRIERRAGFDLRLAAVDPLGEREVGPRERRAPRRRPLGHRRVR
jgi:hypothetical protein